MAVENKRPKFWNMVNVDETSGEIILYGDIERRTPTDWFTGEPVEEHVITPKSFLEDLEKIKDKKVITVRINSGGGDLETGIAIGNVLKGLKAKTIAINEGLIGSAATLISSSCDIVKAYKGTEFMIHQAMGEISGCYTRDDLEKTINSFVCAEKVMLEIYKAKTGLPEEKLKELINAETWMTGEEAKAYGFVDVLIEDENSEPEFEFENNKKILLVNGIKHNIGGLSIPPKVLKRLKNKRLNATGGKRMATKMEKLKNFFLNGLSLFNEAEEEEQLLNEGEGQEEVTEGNPPVKNKKNRKNTEVEELLNEGEDELENEDDDNLENEDDDELVNDDESDLKNMSPKMKAAVLKERRRLQEIDKIAGTICNKKLVREAKYGKYACSAATLAYRALEYQKKINKRSLNNMASDYQNSNANGVHSLGNSGMNTEPDSVQEAKRVANTYLQLKGGKK